MSSLDTGGPRVDWSTVMVLAPVVLAVTVMGVEVPVAAV